MSSIPKLLAVGLLAVTGAAQAPAAEPPAISFTVSGHDVIAQRYEWAPGQVDLQMDFGINLIAGRQAFEIQAHRDTYAEPIEVEQVVGGVRTPLPDGLFTSWTGFKDFLDITIADPAGAVVKQYTSTWCPNSYTSVRTRPDAPATTPYPFACAWLENPFVLGSIWGIQAGYNSPVESFPYYEPDGTQFDLAPGSYRVTARLAEKYRAWLGVSPADATVDLNLTVVDRNAGLRKKPVPAGSEHANEGDASKQLSAYHPFLRPPAKIPTPLASAPAAGPRPDLRSLPAWNIALDTVEGRTNVVFAATVWNAGTSPLLVDGFRRSGTDLMDAYQYFYDAAGNEVGVRPAGTMEWDPRDGHLHWHFTDFAQYNLLTADRSLAVRSGKEAFCLANTDPVDYLRPNAAWRPPNNDLASSCGQNTAVAVRERLDIGNGDTYFQYLPGQSFDVTDLPNGTYWVEVKANPDGKLAELRTTNNASLRKIVLGGTPGGERTLRVPPLHGLD
ncbi:lysyl oxidase family protein [Actinoplanes sp. NPDC051470]|uniref:lysyl oxidase family protein n=1 Tax=Actinoplanes sp. NPDC051470 TaxID=3157224 RepID=UPI0034147F93